MTCSSLPSVGTKLQGKSGYNVPATHSKADPSLVPDFLFAESHNVPEKVTEQDPLAVMIYTEPVPQGDTTEKSAAAKVVAPLVKSIPMLRYLIPGCSADKFWHFSGVSEP